MNKKKLILTTLGVLVGLTLVISATYAWFSTNVTGNENAKNIVSSTATLKIDFTDGKQIVLENAKPGSSTTKTFTVKNTGTDTVYYKINWQEFNNTITNDELTIKLTCTSSSGTCSGVTEEAAYDRDIKDNVELPTGVTHTYTLTVSFIDTNQNQKENQGKSFSGVLQIEGTTARWDKNCENNNSLRCKIITDNTPQSDKSIDFSKISSPTNGQGVYVDDKYGDSENYYFRGGSFCAYTDYASETTAGTKCKSAGGTWSNYKCSLDLSKSTCESKGFTWYELNNNVKFGDYYWKIIRIDDNGDVRLIYNGTSTTSSGSASIIGTAPYNSFAGDSAYVGYMQPATPTKYIRSVSANRAWWSTSSSTEIKMSKNYSFDETTGRYTLTGDIINGSYTDDYIGYYTCLSTSTTSNCDYLVQIVTTDLDENNKHRIKTCKIVSAHYTTSKEQTGNNLIDSQVKAKNDSWFKNNMTSILDKISTNAGYCNNRTSIDKDGGVGNNQTRFSSYSRNMINKLPSYKCKNESNDLFTTIINDLGNKKLSQPVGMISGDEVAYAGGLIYEYNFNYYLQGGYAFWTMSPSYFSGGLTGAFSINSLGFFSDSAVHNINGIRPVIALNSKAIVTSGDGSLANPYIVE